MKPSLHISLQPAIRRTISLLRLAFWAGMILLTPGCATPTSRTSVENPPNIILIITDDQGFGDFGFQGNPVVETPNIDAMAARSARLANFYVSPVCAPTRASLMTGRYNYRTRVVDTYIGRAMMEPEETTLAELLQWNGYATGIFGKWHLGDTYPMRPQDQGFEKTLVHRGGGIGQPSDPPGGEGKYTDPILFEDGVEKAMTGYCTDIYFDQAMRWIEQTAAERPFFAYIPTNAPHTPLQDVPQDLFEHYASMNLSPDLFPEEIGHPLPDEMNADALARIFAMITDIDQNVGRLFERLEALGLLENTLVLFMVDNGPNTRRFVGGYRGMKAEVYEGGIRSPLLAHWPAHLSPGVASDRIAAHIDLTPTILDAAGIEAPADLRFDGRSLMPLLRRESTTWPDRRLFIQTHRGDAPVRYHQFAARSQRWKLLNASGFDRDSLPGDPVFELYDLQNDPYELENVAAQFPDTLRNLIAAYDAWFDDVGHTRPDNYAPPRIVIDPSVENPTVLTRQDWRYPGTHGVNGWARDALGYWLVDVEQEGPYTLDVRFAPDEIPGTARIMINGNAHEIELEGGASQFRLEEITLPAGPATIEAELIHAGKTRGIHQMEIRG